MDALLCQVHSSHGSSAPNKHAGLMLTVLKAYTEVEDLDWRVDDEAFREKMAATGCKMWGGMDVQLYQEVCAGKLRRKVPGGRSEPVGASGRRGLKWSGGERRAGECWQFRSAGMCWFGDDCRFEHDRGQDHGPPNKVQAMHGERLPSTRNKPILNTEHDYVVMCSPHERVAMMPGGIARE